MNAEIITAPVDSGNWHQRFGAGVDAIMEAGLSAALVAAGHQIALTEIDEVGDQPGREIGTGFAVCRVIAARAAEATANGRLPVVIAGNCLSAVGAMAGEGADGIVWLDQHGDLNTPETSAYGFLDGMALACALGLCWRPMLATIPGFEPIDPQCAILGDGRDLDPDEKEIIAELGIVRCSVGETSTRLRELAAGGMRRAHLHIDLDVHDPADLPVNQYASPGGPDRATLRQAVADLVAVEVVSGITVTAYDPAGDPDRRVPAAVQLLLTDALDAMDAARC